MSDVPFEPTAGEQRLSLPSPASPPSPNSPRKLLRRGVPLVCAGAIGAGLAVGIGSAVGFGGTTTTIVREVQPASANASQQASVQPGSSALPEGQLTTQEIYKRAAPGVVEIISTSTVQSVNPFDPFNPQSQVEQGLGSGFVIDKEGHIVTNYHVVQGAQQVRVIFTGTDSVPARVVGVDPSTDIAVLKVDVSSRALTPLTLGNSDQVQVGDRAIAIGNPFGLERTVTEGIVSALQREITAPNDFQIDHVIQTDAAINHGNSGGPLLNGRGEVIGVNAQIQGGTVDGNIGIGFAIPINTVRNVAGQLIENGKVEHAYLGVQLQEVTPALTSNFRMPVGHGLLITRVLPGTPAAAAGLKGGTTQATIEGVDYILGGDIITKIDGRQISSLNDLRDIIQNKKPGDHVTLEVNRNGKTLNVDIKLGRQPNTPTG
jgi:S1-C subfamily serine protease